MKTKNAQTGPTRKELKDLRLLARFIDCWCRVHHRGDKRPFADPAGEGSLVDLRRYRLCAECHELLAYAIARRRKCPLDPKPACKDCPVHCYKPERREEIRRIMRFSGRHLILRGRLDLLWHYFF